MKREQIEELLPEIFRQTLANPETPLAPLLDSMAALLTPSEGVLEHLDSYFDPYRAPGAFVPFLAGWVDLDQVWIDRPETFTAQTLPPFPAGTGRLRELVMAAAYLSQWRGTEKGLRRFLETATGLTGFTIEEEVKVEENDSAEAEPQPFHIRVIAPAEATPYKVLIRRIIELEKPAYVTYELVIEDKQEEVDD
jgi:phage tail-like protein